MAGRVCILSLWICLFLVIPGKCNESLSEIKEELELLEDSLADLKLDVHHVENKTKERINVKRSLRGQVMKDIKPQIDIILKEESARKTIRSQVDSETRHLKRENQQMKRQLQHIMTSLGQVREDNRMYRESQRGDSEKNQFLFCSQCLESNRITSKFADVNDTITELKERVDNLDTLQQQHTRDCTSTSPEPGVSQGRLAASTSESTTSPSSLSSTGVARALSTTIQNLTSTTASSTSHTPQGKRNRILVLPYISDTLLQVQQIHIQSKDVTNYTSLKLKHVRGVVYVFKLNSLLIAQSKPERIIISRLESSTTETLGDGVAADVVAVDEERDLVFFSRIQPTSSICKIDLNGKSFKVLFNTFSSPWSIVLNPKTRTIYVGTGDKLFSLSYDGNNAVTLDTVPFINAAALDVTKGFLYYNRNEDLYRYSLLQNTTAQVASLTFIPFNLRYYRDTLYYSSMYRPGRVEAFDLKRNVSQRLYNGESYDFVALCLVP